MQGTEDFFGEKPVQEKVEALWAKIFESSNKVLHQHKVYGFSGIEVIPSPNVHEMLMALQVLSAVIDVLYAHAGKVDLPYEQQRQLLNAKAQITTMEQLASALKAGAREDYEAAVASLEQQAVI